MSVAAALLLLLMPSAAPDATVRGTVRAESSLEPIAHAVVTIEALDRRVTTDDDGRFVITGVPAGRWEVHVRAFGYRARTLEVAVPARGSVRFDIALERDPVELEGVEAIGEAERIAPAAAAGPGAVRMEGPKIRLVPGVVQSDVLRAVQMLPSVAAVSDFSSALYVRGGSPDQNLITLDGAPIFNPYHLGGLFSAFDPAVVKSVDVLAGAFPAGVGDRLSGAIRIATRDGGRDHISGRGSIGLVSTRATLDGPLPGGDGSFVASLRRTYFDLFTDAAYGLGLIDFTLPYNFTDAHLKLTHDVGSFGSLTGFAYVATEGVHLPERMQRETGSNVDFSWGSRALSIAYRQPIGAALVGEVQAAYSAFRGGFHGWETDETFGPDGEVIEVGTSTFLDAEMVMRDIMIAADLTWYEGDHTIRTGLQLDAYRFDYDISQVDLSGYVPEFQRTSGPSTVAAYLSNEWQPSGALRLRAGLRVLYAGDHGTAWLPRIGARYQVSPRVSLSIGAGRYAQVLHSLRNQESLAATLVAYDFLAAVPREIGLSTARDVVLGAEWNSGAMNVRVNVYAKWMENLPIPPIPDDPLEAPVLVIDGFREGSGTAQGVELLAGREFGDARVSLAYSLSFAERSVDGESYTPRFHRRHALNATAVVPFLDESGTVSARLKLATGQPYTPALGVTRGLRYRPDENRFEPLGGATILRGEHNSARLPGYFRLDLAVRKDFGVEWFGRKVTITPYLQVINVLNTNNVLAGHPEAYGASGPEVEYAPQLPILPTFGVEWTF